MFKNNTESTTKVYSRIYPEMPYSNKEYHDSRDGRNVETMKTTYLGLVEVLNKVDIAARIQEAEILRLTNKKLTDRNVESHHEDTTPSFEPQYKSKIESVKFLVRPKQYLAIESEFIPYFTLLQTIHKKALSRSPELERLQAEDVSEPDTKAQILEVNDLLKKIAQKPEFTGNEVRMLRLENIIKQLEELAQETANQEEAVTETKDKDVSVDEVKV